MTLDVTLWKCVWIGQSQVRNRGNGEKKGREREKHTNITAIASFIRYIYTIKLHKICQNFSEKKHTNKNPFKLKANDSFSEVFMCYHLNIYTHTHTTNNIWTLGTKAFFLSRFSLSISMTTANHWSNIVKQWYKIDEWKTQSSLKLK